MFYLECCSFVGFPYDCRTSKLMKFKFLTTRSLSSPTILCLLGVVLSPSLARAQDTSQSPTLEAKVKAIAGEHHGDVALFAENLATHETVAISPDTPVQTASVIK